MPRGRQRRDASEARAAMPRRLDGRGAQTLRTFIIGRISSGWGGPERSLRRWRRRRQSAARRLHSGGHVRCVRVGRARAMHADAQRAQPRSMSETGHLPTDVESSDPDPGAATLQPGALRPSAPPSLRPSPPTWFLLSSPCSRRVGTTRFSAAETFVRRAALPDARTASNTLHLPPDLLVRVRRVFLGAQEKKQEVSSKKGKIQE